MIINPVVSIALGVWIFGEHFVLDAGALALAAAGFCVMCGGVVLLSAAAPDTVAADPGPPQTAAPVREQG